LFFHFYFFFLDGPATWGLEKKNQAVRALDSLSNDAKINPGTFVRSCRLGANELRHALDFCFRGALDTFDFENQVLASPGIWGLEKK